MFQKQNIYITCNKKKRDEITSYTLQTIYIGQKRYIRHHQNTYIKEKQMK